MTTLQEYLQEKYPNSEDKKQVQELIFSQITEQLSGGELDLREFPNLEKVEISTHFLSTPLTKIIVDGLTKLREIIYEGTEEETEEEKKLWEELGITGDIIKKRVVREVQRLAKIKSVEVKFGEGESSANNIFLNLDQKDKADNFCPSLVFWNLAWELSSAIEGGKTNKNPDFWKKFEEELVWVKDNLIVLPIEERKPDFRRDFELLSNPSTFPHSELDMSELLAVYFPNSEDIPDSQIVKSVVNKEIVNQTWQTIYQELMNLLSQELKNSPDEEKLKELVFKATVDYSEQEYIIQVNYHPNNPFKDNLKELLTITPLKLEIKNLKQKQEQLPTSENFAKLTKQNQAWDNYLQDFADTKEKYQEIKDEINKID